MPRRVHELAVVVAPRLTQRALKEDIMAGTLDRAVTSVATQLMLATACTADEVSENAWLRGAYRVGQGEAMTSGRSVPCRSFTNVHAVSELTFSVSQRMPQNLGVTSTLDKRRRCRSSYAWSLVNDRQEY
jgi:hypothetical protein